PRPHTTTTHYTPTHPSHTPAPPPTTIYTLSLHDALPISHRRDHSGYHYSNEGGRQNLRPDNLRRRRTRLHARRRGPRRERRRQEIGRAHVGPLEEFAKQIEASTE